MDLSKLYPHLRNLALGASAMKLLDSISTGSQKIIEGCQQVQNMAGDVEHIATDIMKLFEDGAPSLYSTLTFFSLAGVAGAFHLATRQTCNRTIAQANPPSPQAPVRHDTIQNNGTMAPKA